MLNDHLLAELKLFIQKYRSIDILECKLLECSEDSISSINQCPCPSELNDYISNKRKKTFSEVLLKLIDKSGVSDAEIYKKAGIDRRHFSKIRSNSVYKPSKNTAVALAMALELDCDQFDKLLSAAGYSLSESDTTDLVIRFFLEKKIYDLQQINEALDYFSLKPLSGVQE